MYDVIIVGGGAAGLMAAKILSEKKIKVLLLEAKEKLGGRITQVEFSSFTAEGGAEFIHGNLKTTFGLLKEAGLKKQKIKGDFCRVKNGKWSTDEEQIPHWDVLIKKMKECDKDITIDDFLQQIFHAKKYDNLKKRFKQYIQGYDTADTKYANVFSIRKEMEEEDEDQYRPEPDYSVLINFLQEVCKKNNVVIKTNEPVKKINYGQNVEVETSFDKYSCNKIIIAVPLGILQRNKREKGFINFPPSIKNYITAARKIGNGSVIKFLAEFDNAFWLDKSFLKEKNIAPPSYIFTDATIPTWWSQHPSKKPLLTGWLGGPDSYKMKNYSDKKFEEILVESLSSIFSLSPIEIKKRLKKFVVMNWIKELYILGAYSYPTLYAEEARKLINKPFENTIYFAGEYVEKNSTSTVDAALISGREVANQILKL